MQQAIDALAAQERGGCTISLHPGQDLPAALAAFQGDGTICLGDGIYQLPATLVIQGKGHLRIRGAGQGTRLVAPATGEAAMVVQGCASVSISDLTLIGSSASSGAPGTDGLMGALTVLDCSEVNLTEVTAATAHGTQRAATCITIRNSPAFVQEHPFARARVRGCHLSIGHHQTGLLLANVARAQVEDNTMAATGTVQTATLLQDVGYRARLRSTLFSHAALMDQKPPASLVAVTNAEVIRQGFRVRFRTNDLLVKGTDGLINEWQKAVDAVQPAVTSSLRLKQVVEGLVDSFLLGGGTIGGFTTPFLLQAFGRLVGQDTVVGGQGVVVAGSVPCDVRVIANDIRGVLQGVHVALSHRETGPGTPDQVRTLLIDGNTIEVALPSSATGERHGIFVGSCRSAVIEANYLRLRRVATGVRRPTDAIRAFGRLGRRLIVRHNHLEAETAADAFDVGVRFNPTNPTGLHMWLVGDNLMDQVGQTVVRPANVDIIGIPDNRS